MESKFYWKAMLIELELTSELCRVWNWGLLHNCVAVAMVENISIDTLAYDWTMLHVQVTLIQILVLICDRQICQTYNAKLT